MHAWLHACARLALPGSHPMIPTGIIIDAHHHHAPPNQSYTPNHRASAHGAMPLPHTSAIGCTHAWAIGLIPSACSLKLLLIQYHPDHLISLYVNRIELSTVSMALQSWNLTLSPLSPPQSSTYLLHTSTTPPALNPDPPPSHPQVWCGGGTLQQPGHQAAA